MFVSYRRDTGELHFGTFFYRNEKEYIDHVIINIGRDLEFELISLFARYDRPTKQHVDILKNTLIFNFTIWEKFKGIPFFRTLIEKDKVYYGMFDADYLNSLFY
jgi:hypothetical protein